MATWTEKIPVDEIIAARQDRQLRPGRLLLTLVLGVFFVLGWLAGRTWLLAADSVNAVRLGWWRGTGLTDAQIAERLKPAPAPG